jgi:hypothetical protein
MHYLPFMALDEGQFYPQAPFPDLSKDCLNQLEEPEVHENLLPEVAAVQESQRTEAGLHSFFQP